jgi:hypothetical protein
MDNKLKYLHHPFPYAGERVVLCFDRPDAIKPLTLECSRRSLYYGYWTRLLDRRGWKLYGIVRIKR